jgi:hypothetical protein
LPALSLLWSAPVFAQDDEPTTGKGEDEAAAPSDKPTEGVKGPAHESLVPPKPVEAEQPPPIGPVERLPPTAYPEWKTRGIPGGS